MKRHSPPWTLVPPTVSVVCAPLTAGATPSPAEGINKSDPPTQGAVDGSPSTVQLGDCSIFPPANGANWYEKAVRYEGFDVEFHHILGVITGNNSEALDTAAMMANLASGQVVVP